MRSSSHQSNTGYFKEQGHRGPELLGHLQSPELVPGPVVAPDVEEDRVA